MFGKLFFFICTATIAYYFTYHFDIREPFIKQDIIYYCENKIKKQKIGIFVRYWYGKVEIIDLYDNRYEKINSLNIFVYKPRIICLNKNSC